MVKSTLYNWLINWLNTERTADSQTFCNFRRLSSEIQPCDVLLVEGRSRASTIVKTLTQSIWTHSAIYIGRMEDIQNPELRQRIKEHYPAKPHEQLLIEPLLGKGTIITPLSRYKQDHLRICRPKGLSPDDIDEITRYVVNYLGKGYNLRHVFDLARFSLPYSFIPRRWRSTLFEYQSGIPNKTMCSSMIAGAFSTIHYPIRPIVRHKRGRIRLYKRNTRMYIPSDFDTSPFFDVIKYPFPGFDDPRLFRQLPWENNGMICNTERECFDPLSAKAEISRATLIFNKVTKPEFYKQLIPIAIPFTNRRL